MESLLKLRKVDSMLETESLRKLASDVENCVRNLRSMNVETSTYGSLLIPILKERLPDELVFHISRCFEDEVWTLDKLIEYMNKEIRTSENCSSFLGGSSSSPSSKGKSTTWNLFGGMSEDVADKCVFCSKDHASHKCRKVTNVKSRTDMLRRDRRCFLCLKKGHQKRECRVKYICRNCNGKHNIAICFGKGDRNERNRERDRDRNRGGRDQENRVRNGDRGGEDRERDQDDGESLEEIQQGLVMSARAERESILLQTATAYIQDKCKRQGSFSKILFDSGSQRSFVTQALRDKLQLKSERKEKVVIKTFGEGDNSKKVSKFLDVVTIKVKHKGRNSFTAVEALCVPRICGSISKVFDRSKYDHLMDLELADTFNAVSIDYPVGVLVGIDFYHDFFSGKTKTDNFKTSEKRLVSLKKRLEKSDLVKRYNEVFEEYKKEGIIEKVPENEISAEVGKVHYLPHRPVVKEDRETTKIRAVFDASCETTNMDQTLSPEEFKDAHDRIIKKNNTSSRQTLLLTNEDIIEPL
ncbi:uncharacterized protein [Clytia hemisphaerica]|uniref:uncharacterized protein n=1 Tax=Clytia hemisphaerica TaxID=252671 RepID=UPI0034D7366B